MRILFLNNKPPLKGADLDPRRRKLYGDDVIWISPETIDNETSDLLPPRPWHILSKSRTRLSTRIKYIKSQYPDSVLIIGDHRIAFLLRDSGIKFVFDPTDSSALFYKRRARAYWINNPVKFFNSIRLHLHYRYMESIISQYASLFMTTGPADEAYLRKINPHGNFFLVGNGTEMAEQPPVTPNDDGKTIGFHGGMTWEPNRMTAARLSGSIAEELAKISKNQIKIEIAGRPVFPELQRFDGVNNVRVLGFVDDIQSWLSSLSLYVMPMYQGGGVKNKLLEALAAGLPVLTNTLGAEAIPEEDRDFIAVAENDAELVQTIIDLLKKPDRLLAMRAAGRRYAEKNFLWENQQQRLHSELHNLKSTGRL